MKEIYRYYSQVREVKIRDEIDNDIDFAVSILDELAEKYPFLHFQIHIEMDEEAAARYMKAACTYTSNINYKD